MSSSSQLVLVAAAFVVGCLAFVVSAAPATADTPDPKSCQDAPIKDYPFCDTALPWEVRAKDLVARMTAEEKISQFGNTASSINRLGVPAYQWWSEGLHGVANSPAVHFGGDLPAATSFPQIAGIGATFDMELVRAMATVISTEGRAFNNKGAAGLDFWTPNINIVRDPRWGRAQETPGEDPFLTSQYAINFAHGMQLGADLRTWKVVATPKHFAAYDLENWGGVDRHHFDARVSDRDLVETYLPAFEAAVRQGAAQSVMCSYNAVNGVPSCANSFLLQDVLRGKWGFSGYVVSDCGAIRDIRETHNFTSTPAATVAAGIRAGCDLDCGGYYAQHMQAALDGGALGAADVDRALVRLFGLRVQLGMFDPPAAQPYRALGPHDVNTPAHQALALRAARESVVLLQNRGGALPLDAARVKRVAVIGPHFNATHTLQGNYFGVAPYLVSPLAGLAAYAAEVEGVQGCEVAGNSTAGFAAATAAAAAADATVLLVGLDQSQESEGHDRTALGLPGVQDALIAAVAAASRGPVAVVVLSGASVDLRGAAAAADAVLWAGYPGQSGGQAVADVLFGAVNPSGRLPFTMYPADFAQQVSMFNMDMRPSGSSPGRTYKFYTGTPVFPFGHGLSYTTFSYTWSTADPAAAAQAPTSLRIADVAAAGRVAAALRVTVKNTGARDGSASVLAFASFGDVRRTLFDFDRVTLKAGESRELFFEPDARAIATVTADGHRVLTPGTVTLRVGDIARTVQLTGEPLVIERHPSSRGTQ